MNSITTPPAAGALHRAVREPLVHFLVLGALVFGIDHAIVAARGNPQEIVVTQALQKEARDAFAASMKREPSAADMKILEERWIDNEVLYREGLALGLDRGDSTIRDRVIFKAMSVTQASLVLPKADEAGVRAWFEAHRDRYDTPARFDFAEAAVPDGLTPAQLQALVNALNGQGETDIESSLRIFKDRPRENLVQSYGAAFADALATQAPGEWVLLAAGDGSRVVRVESVKPGTSAEFDAMQERVYQDWKDDTMARLATQAVREMGRKYRVRVEEAGS